MSFFTSFLKLLQTPVVRQTAIAALPQVVRALHGWISSASYIEAKERIERIRSEDAAQVFELYRAFREQMSPDVAKAFEEELRQQGKL